MHELLCWRSDLWRSQSVVKATTLLLFTSFLFTLYASTQLAGFGTGTELPVRSNWQHMDTANMRTLVKLYAQPKPYTFRLLHPNSIHLDTEDITKLGIAGGSGFSKLNEEVAAMAKESAGKKVKTVYMIRHGEGNHNTAEKKFGKEHWEKVEALKDKYLDASLNEVGIEQCRRVQAAITAGLDGGMLVDGIIVSPLSRALETAAIVMEKVWTNTKVPKVAVEMTRERLGKNQCDKRRSNKELKEKWPMVDFDHFMNAEEDIWWTPVRETNEQVKERSQHFFQWLMDTEWESIVLVGHSSFMSNTYELLSGGDTHWPSNGEVVPIVIEATPQ